MEAEVSYLHISISNLLNTQNNKHSEQDLIELQLHKIIEGKLLSAKFQPIINMQDGTIFGYEGLIRGPSDSILHSPVNLFKAAWDHNLTIKVEHLCRRVVLEQFHALQLPGKLFLNVSPECLLLRDVKHGETLDYIHELGINPERVIIELTEYQPCHDYELLKEAVLHYRNMGFEIAIDDLGEGFSSLRLWSELKPDYVKIDMHFIQGIQSDPIKMQFIRSIQGIAEKSGTRVVAEGIESHDELIAIQNLGVALGQGYHIAKPHSNPSHITSAEVMLTLSHPRLVNTVQLSHQVERSIHIKSLVKNPLTINSRMTNNEVVQLFLNDPALKMIPVVDDDLPVGMISRHTVVDMFARPYQRELCGKKSCKDFMDANALMIDQSMSLQQVSHIVVEADSELLINGMLVVDEGKYVGLVTGPELMRAITKMQIQAARYANPLTLLPGNVPINEQINLLLKNDKNFIVCYCDLDNFKPFNDVYGYQRGDEVIQMTSKVLAQYCDDNKDFIGHIGGDDFIILFESEDWEVRCQRMLVEFEKQIAYFYSTKDWEQGGYLGEDRRGAKIFHPIISISLGAIYAHSKHHFSHHQIAFEAAEAKKQAKKMSGNSFFYDRRNRPHE